MMSQHQLANLFISSSDSLRGNRVPQEIPEQWNDHPPLLKNVVETEQILREINRQGIPPALRCAVWISAVVHSSNPHQKQEYSAEYRTLGKVVALDTMWDVTRNEVFPDESDDNIDDIPNFGMGEENLQLLLYFNHGGTPIPKRGKKSLMRVLRVVEHVLGIDCCPLLPCIVTILLNYMTESYAFASLRAMALDAPYFFPTTIREHYGWCRAFSDILRRLHPQTAKTMEEIGALSPDGLDPIFKHFFTPILQYEHVLRLMDIYCYEGSKVLFRFGVALLCLSKRALKEEKATSKEDWWNKVKAYTHSKSFRFDYLVKKAYGFHGSGVRKKVRFPRREIIYKIIEIEEGRAIVPDKLQKELAKPRPLGMVSGEIPIVLGKLSSVRSSLSEWLPASLQLTKLDLVFSSDKHGRTLERFYHHCKHYKHTITLMEVLNNGATIGMYASQAWRKSTRTYGDGECFLFRVKPNPVVFKWRPIPLADHVNDLNEEHHRSLVDQFMQGRDTLVGIGGSENGSVGLGLNEDMTRGSSDRAEGFQNDPLPGDGITMFDVGLVEVYRLVRQVDGKGVDESDAFAKVDESTATTSLLDH